MSSSIKERKPVLVVGGANGERVISVPPRLYEPGRKHVLGPSEPIGGGSSVNHGCRLLGTGVGILPVIPVLNDHTGQLIARTLEDAARTGGVDFEFEKRWFMSPTSLSDTTQFTTIVSVGEERSVFSEFSEGLAESFVNHFNALIPQIDPSGISAVVIGHIYADRETNGDLTRKLVEKYSEHVPIISNFGASQYEAGDLAWARIIKKMSYFQLDISEIRRFFKQPDIPLREALTWFRDKCTLVITLDRLGAIAQTKGSDKVIQIWPYEMPPDMLVDTTGAGDAFAAGVSYSLVRKRHMPRKPSTWLDIFERSTLWAAYACCKRGGTREIPNLRDLDVFGKAYKELTRGVDVLDSSVGLGTLRLVDLAFTR